MFKSNSSRCLSERRAAGRVGRGRGRRARRGGATLLETTVCLIFVLLPLLLGGLQFGLILTTTHALEQISREAGRFAAVHYAESTFDGSASQGDNSSDPPSLRNYIKQVSADNGIPYNDISGVSVGGKPALGGIEVTPAAASRESGQLITVKITYPMRKRVIVGKLPFVNGDSQSMGMFLSDYVVASSFLME